MFHILQNYFLVHLIVATPGRILDLMNKGLVKTESCKILVLDEVSMFLRVVLSYVYCACVEFLNSEQHFIQRLRGKYLYYYFIYQDGKRQNYEVMKNFSLLTDSFSG